MVLSGLKVPVPLVLHCPALPPLIRPESASESFEQMLVSAPATAAVAIVVLITTVSVTALQSPLFVEVRTSVTLPAAESARLKV